MYKHFIKRFLDIVLSLLIIIFFSPVLLLLAILVKLDSPGPVVFKQQRLGLNGKEFTMYKYRSMCVNAESQGTGVYSDSGDPRVTRLGKILRATSADELPQAFNILKGDMSFIGPRPPLTYHPWKLEEYTEHQRRMFEMRPGITGWAQVNGRKVVEWNRRIDLNVWYIDNASFLLDLKIFFMTIFKIFANDDNSNIGKTVVEKTEETVTK